MSRLSSESDRALGILQRVDLANCTIYPSATTRAVRFTVAPQRSLGKPGRCVGALCIHRCRIMCAPFDRDGAFQSPECASTRSRLVRVSRDGRAGESTLRRGTSGDSTDGETAGPKVRMIQEYYVVQLMKSHRTRCPHPTARRANHRTLCALENCEVYTRQSGHDH